jgi:peroxiredoxin Q/BCP
MSDATPAKIGQPAPGFTLPADGGRTLSLAGLRGSAVVLYFYPKDDTSGCTREALDFTEGLAEFEAARTVVIGISKDPVRNHEKFIGKHALGVTLVSDAGSNVCECYGTWIEKSMYGRRYMGIERATFLIDADGILRREWRKVKVPGHVAEVLAAARALRGLPSHPARLPSC